MKFSGKMCFKIILKVTKNQGSTLSLEDTFFEKPQGGFNLTLPPPLRHFGVKVLSDFKNLKQKVYFIPNKELIHTA